MEVSVDNLKFDIEAKFTNKAGQVKSAKSIFCILWTYAEDVLLALKELLTGHPIWLWIVGLVIKAGDKAYINLGCDTMQITEAPTLMLKAFNGNQSGGDIEAEINAVAKDDFEDNHFEMLKEFILNCEVVDFVMLKRHIETESAKQPE